MFGVNLLPELTLTNKLRCCLNPYKICWIEQTLKAFKMTSVNCPQFCCGLNVLNNVPMFLLSEMLGTSPDFPQHQLSCSKQNNNYSTEKQWLAILTLTKLITKARPGKLYRNPSWEKDVSFTKMYLMRPSAHWGQNKMADISQTTFWNAFSLNIILFLYFHRNFNEVSNIQGRG